MKSPSDLYGLRRLGLLLILAAILLISPLTTRSAIAQTVPAEIVELARALKGDPDLIHEYVYNNIDTLPQYGSLKGPLGALLDGKGTAFDQAELMVALLQQAGLTASYQIGAIQLSTSQLTNWLGTDNSCGSLDFTLGTGGFPTTFVPNPCATVATAAQIGSIWVVVNIGGTDFVFDPATKVYNRSTGVANLASILGYTQSNFIGNAGVVLASPTKLTGLNRTNVRINLATYSDNLVQYIRANNSAANATDIIGGKTIVPLALGTQLRQTSLSYAVAGTVQNVPTIPNSFRTLLTLQFGSNDPSNNAFSALSSPITFNSSNIYGHRLVVSFDSSLRPALLLDGVAQITANSAVPSGRRLTIRTSISHPYPSSFADISNSDQIRVSPPSVAGAGLIYLIGTGWGQVGRGMIEKHRKLLQQNTAQYPGNPTAEPVLGESLAMLGYSWLAELSQQQQIVDQLANTNTLFQHAVGVVGIKAVGTSGASVGPFVDLPLNDVGIIQRIARPAQTTFVTTPIEASAFFCEAIFLSIAESGMIEQTQPGATAASTVKLIDTTIQSGGAIFDINNANISGDNCIYYGTTIRSQLGTYSVGDLARIDSLVGFFQLAPGVFSCSTGPTLRVIAPANGSIAVDQFTGAGYFQILQDGTAVGSIITGGLSGGESASPVPPDVVVNNTNFFGLPPTVDPYVTTLVGVPLGNLGGFAGWTQITLEPINLVSGDYLINTTDLSVGSQSMPIGLSFQRYYDSGTKLKKGPLGFGWTHNFAITALPGSDSFGGLGATSPINGAAAIAAIFVTLDILNNGLNTAKPLDRVVIASVVQRWLMDQITTNVVAITQPGLIEQFTKLSDGSFNPPSGSAATLTFVDGSFTYTAKNGRTLSFDSVGNLSIWRDPSGAKMTLHYSGAPVALASVTNNFGRTLTFAYASGQLTQVSDESGRGVSYAYDSSGNLSSFTDTLGNSTNYLYDLPGRLTQTFYPSAPTSPFVTNTYDLLDRVKTQADANNNVWQYFLAGTRSEEINPLGMRHVIYVSPRGKTLTEIQDFQGLNQVTTNTYDGLDRVTSTTAPEGNSVSYSYDAKNNVLRTTTSPKPGSPVSPLVTSYSYDSLYNKPISVTDPRGIVSAMDYDPATGNLRSVVKDFGGGRLNATSLFTYNAAGQVLTATDPNGAITQFGYDSFGNQTSVIRDAGSARLSQLLSLSYSALGDVVSATDPRGSITTNTYNAARRLLTTTAPNGTITALSYDPDGRVLSTQQSASGAVLKTTIATYTLTGKPSTSTDSNGNVTTANYDGLDRLASTTDPVGRTMRYAYDALSRQIKLFNPAIQSAPLLEQSFTPNGVLASLTDANSNTTSYVYDGFDRLDTVTYPVGSTETFTYDADSNVLTRKTRANQTITFTYDTLNRLSTKTTPSAAMSYSYDLNNRLLTASDNSAATAAAAPPTPNSPLATTLAYDALNRPTTVSWTPVAAATPPPASSITFAHSYNKANQRVGQTVSDNTWLEYPAATPSAISYTSNALNQYIAVGAVTPSYDGNGNLSSDGIFTYGYDAESRMVSASGPGVTATYAYDAQGRRKSKTVNGVTTISVTDADNREVLEYDGASGALQRWYAYGLGSNDVLDQVNVVAATRATLIPDIQGSIIATQDSSTGAIAKVGYRPYGGSASTAGSFRYTGQRIDAEIGCLYYYRARHYSPAWGRFMQADPIGYKGGINLYAYVGNDPLNLIDPHGFAADSALVGFGKYLSGSAYAFGKIPSDVARMASDFLTNPSEFFSAAGPGLAGFGMSIPAVSVVKGLSQEVDSGGRLGSAITRAQIRDIASDFEGKGYTVTGGGGKLPETYIPGPGGGRTGSAYPDITLQSPGGNTVYVNTVDTLRNGITPTTREIRNATKIEDLTGTPVILIPKR